jgi:hypothetical protein
VCFVLPIVLIMEKGGRMSHLDEEVTHYAIILTSLHEEPVDVASIGGLGHELFLGQILDLEVKANSVDADLVLASKILQRPRQESLREKETRDPVGGRDAILDPFLDEVHTMYEIHHPSRQRLQTRICDIGPHFRHLYKEEGGSHE